MTGVAVYHVPEQRLANAWQCTAEQYATWARDFIMGSRHMESGVVFAVERFVISGRTVRQSRGDHENWSLELIGLTRYMCGWYNQQFELQDAGAAKKMAPNDKLKQVNWHSRGKDHANDAVRHIVLARARLLGEAPPWV